MSSRPNDAAAPPARAGTLLRGPWLAPCLGLLCFANSLANHFAYDDHPLIVENPRIRTLTSFRDLWLSDWWQPASGVSAADPLRDRLYRPLTLFSFALNYAVHGYRPFGYHAVNVALHATACLLLWHFVRRFVGDPAIASVAAVLFAVHPIHAEAVANVVGRAELLAALLLLAGLVLLLPRTGAANWQRGLLAAPLFLLALLSKETAVCYPAVALLVCFGTTAAHRTCRWWLAHATCLALPLVIYFPLRFVALDQRLFRLEPAAVHLNPLVTATLAERVLGAGTVLGHYTRLLVAPANLSADYGLAIVDPRAGPTAVTVLGLVTGGGIVIGLLAWRRRGTLPRLIAVLTAISLASYALISNTFLLIGVSLAERLMYWPSVPVLLLAALGAVHFWRTMCRPGCPWEKRAGLLRRLGVVFLAALALRTVVRNMDWRDNLTLVSRDVATYPQSAHFNRGYAQELLKLALATPDTSCGTGLQPVISERRQLLETADQHLATALRIDPVFVGALGLRAVVHAQLGDADGARQYAESALLLDPTQLDALAVLNGLRAASLPDLAQLRADVASRPDDPPAELALGSALLGSGNLAEAREHLARAVALAPDDPAALRRLGQAQALLSQPAEAIESFEQVLRLDPDDWTTHTNLAGLLADRDPAAALQHAQRAHELKPDDVRAAVNLAEALERAGRKPEALGLYDRILQSLPASDPFRDIIDARIKVLRRP